jgi:hypothetical protein
VIAITKCLIWASSVNWVTVLLGLLSQCARDWRLDGPAAGLMETFPFAGLTEKDLA